MIQLNPGGIILTNLVINLDKINKFSKIKHSIIVISLILLLFLLPFFIEYVPNYSPYRSINNQEDYGHANLANNLSSDYQIDRLTGDLNNLGSIIARDNILVIIAPENKYKSDDIELLDNWINRGGGILIVGTNEETIGLANYYNYFYDDFSGIDFSLSKRAISSIIAVVLSRSPAFLILARITFSRNFFASPTRIPAVCAIASVISGAAGNQEDSDADSQYS